MVLNIRHHRAIDTTPVCCTVYTTPSSSWLGCHTHHWRVWLHLRTSIISVADFGSCAALSGVGQASQIAPHTREHSREPCTPWLRHQKEDDIRVTAADELMSWWADELMSWWADELMTISLGCPCCPILDDGLQRRNSMYAVLFILYVVRVISD